jgi:hypothetical protein
VAVSGGFHHGQWTRLLIEAAASDEAVEVGMSVFIRYSGYLFRRSRGNLAAAATPLRARGVNVSDKSKIALAVTVYHVSIRNRSREGTFWAAYGEGELFASHRKPGEFNWLVVLAFFSLRRWDCRLRAICFLVNRCHSSECRHAGSRSASRICRHDC